MARRPRNTESAPAEGTTDPTNEENPVTDTAVETPVEASDTPAVPEQTEAPAAESAPVDLTAFTTAVEAAVEARDTSTGDVPADQLAPVQAAYRDLDGLKAKNAARALIAERMKAAMNNLDITSARAFMVLTEGLSAAGSKSSADKPPADPKQAFTERYQAILLAAELVAAEAPEGVTVTEITVPDGALASAQALAAYNANEAEDKGDAPESSPVVRAALKLASGKASGARKAGVGTGSNGGVRRDIGEHIKSAFADVDAGTFLTVAEIRAHKSAEYGDEPPSAGAISARLFPSSGKSTVEGVEPGTNDKGTRGATKLAS